VLRSVGVESPAVLEHGFRSAMVGGVVKCRFVVVHSYGPGTPQEPKYGDVLRKVTLTGGVSAAIVSTPGFGTVVRFVCSAVGYDVASLDANLDPGSGDAGGAERLANLMTEHLDCI
jgi:hypothetical protein